MTNDKWEAKIPTNNPCEDLFKKAMASLDFANWVADEIFDDMWEYNKDAFAEIACRKLAKLGIVKEVDGEKEGSSWILQGLHNLSHL